MKSPRLSPDGRQRAPSSSPSHPQKIDAAPPGKTLRDCINVSTRAPHFSFRLIRFPPLFCLQESRQNPQHPPSTQVISSTITPTPPSFTRSILSSLISSFLRLQQSKHIPPLNLTCATPTPQLFGRSRFPGTTGVDSVTPNRKLPIQLDLRSAVPLTAALRPSTRMP